MSAHRQAFFRGVLASVPFVIVIVPFGVLFGVVATDAGMTPWEVLAFSLVVIAGAAQFAAVQLMNEGAPLLIVLVTSIAVNLRMAMYSAALTPHLGGAPGWQRAIMAYFLVDQSFAAASAEFAKRPDQSLSEKVTFYFGAVAPVCPLWYAASYGGAVFGKAIPPEYALDFAVPIAFLAITAPMLRTRAHVAAAVVSVSVALALVWMPYSTGLLVAAAAAMATGAAVELHDERRAARRT
ncbi:branched-chain amino acid ABC transporter permease [Aliigemmobacter aestuarii]|uniref:Branched-chain amino acid ABC transporter permease n=1 Tax=Aliigemmobacter aestuarii TaxID=1445661 RepID=A0A4S3MP78_9RHOB|nr:AzlC family ABC transporter permease [Gemmobacter aestuarii]THD83535.1 branched-chain amino acid ABC transporter permease [Gemmobacter aestuarii]